MSEEGVVALSDENVVTVDRSFEYGTIARCCAICGGSVLLRSYTDPATICEGCRKFLLERALSHKSNWIPGSKGGEPNCRR